MSRPLPPITLPARVVAVMVSDGEGFATRPVRSATLDLEGFVLEGLRGERHRGFARAADARVPWYRRGTPIRNSRQVSLVSVEDLAAIAAGLDVPEVKPEWLGANVVVEGVADFSMLPRGSRIMFPGGAAVAVEEQNVPCRGPGRVIAAAYPDRSGIEFAFVRTARRLRGLVGWVERAGVASEGDNVDVRIPEQWLYEAAGA
jgi:hypothetical protein